MNMEVYQNVIPVLIEKRFLDETDANDFDKVNNAFRSAYINNSSGHYKTLLQVMPLTIAMSIELATRYLHYLDPLFKGLTPFTANIVSCFDHELTQFSLDWAASEYNNTITTANTGYIENESNMLHTLGWKLAISIGFHIAGKVARSIMKDDDGGMIDYIDKFSGYLVNGQGLREETFDKSFKFSKETLTKGLMQDGLNKLGSLIGTFFTQNND